MSTLFQIPEDFAALSEDELRSFIASAREVAARIAADHSEFISDDLDGEALMEEMTNGVAAIGEARAELARREAEEPVEEPEETEEQPEAASTVDQEALAALAARAAEETETTEPETPAEPTAVAAELPVTEIAHAALAEAVETATAKGVEAGIKAGLAAVETVTASAEEKPKRLGRPARSRRAEPQQSERTEELVAMTAAGDIDGHSLGEDVDRLDIASMMMDRRRRFGAIPDKTHDDVPIARASWSDSYPEERRLDTDEAQNFEKVEAVVASAAAQREIKDRLAQRRNREESALVASGGLCAPVTPYYQLAMISVADRPVRAALPAFNADRGGIKYARPAALSAITTGVGTKTVAQDAAGGTTGTKGCQAVDCPSFQETDIEIIYHCLKFGNVGARTFPERVAQWNDLVLAAHARVAETVLLDGIDAASTAVTATDSSAVPLGASAHLLSQMITAGQAMRNRHRMDPDAVLRVLLPEWVLELLVSDVYRSQFQRFEMNEDRFVALLRDNDIEPTFYLDGATGASQVFGTQSAAALLGFPSTVRWYIYPEGSFVYVDGGVLELGLVRDSTLNSTNDFEIFGESFENVAFVGVESLAVTSTVCDSGAVTLPVSYTECGDYGSS